MRRTRVFSCLFVCLLALPPNLLLPALARAQEPRVAGVVTAVQGRATVAHLTQPQPQPLHFKDDVFFQDKVTTERDSVVKVLLQGKALVTIRELSDFTIAEGPNKATVNLGLGRLALQVLKRLMRPGEEVEVRTPNAIAAVRGSFVVVDVSLAAGVPTTNVYALQITAPVTVTALATGASATLSSFTAVSLQGVGAAARLSPVITIPPAQAATLAQTAVTPHTATPTAPPSNLASNISSSQSQQATLLAQAISSGTVGTADPALASASTQTQGQGGGLPPPPPLPPPSTANLGVNASQVTQTVNQAQPQSRPPGGPLFLVQNSTVTVNPSTSLVLFGPGPLQVPGFGGLFNQTGPVPSPLIQATGGLADTLAINTLSGGALLQFDNSQATPASPITATGPLALINGTNVITNTLVALTSGSTLTSTASPAAFQVINGGSLIASSLVSADGTGNTFTHTGTLLALDHAFVVLGSLEQHSGSDVVTLNRPTQPAISLDHNSLLTVSPGGLLRVPGGTTGSPTLIALDNGSILLLQPGATFDIQTDQALATSTPGTPGQIVNAGTLQKSAGTGTTAVTAGLNNTGTVAVQSGTLSLQGGGTDTGTFTIASGTTLAFGGGTHNLNPGSVLSGAGDVNVTDGTVNFSGAYQVTGTTTVSGGTLASPGTLVSVPAGAALNLDSTLLSVNGTGSVTAGASVVGVAGTLTSTGAAPLVQVQGNGSITASSDVLQVAAGGTVHLAGSAFSDPGATVNLLNTHVNTMVAMPVVGASPQPPVFTLDGTKAYVYNLGAGTVSVINSATSAVVGSPLTVPLGIQKLTLTPDGTKLYAAGAGVSLINVATDTVTPLPGLGTSAYPPVFTSTEGFIVNNATNQVLVINPATGSEVAPRVAVGNLPGPPAITPDGSKVYVANLTDGTITVINTSTNSAITTIAAAQLNVTNPMAPTITPDGKQALVVGIGSNRLAIIDTSTNNVIATLDMGAFAQLPAVVPDGSKAYVATGANVVKVLDLESGPGARVIATVTDVSLNQPQPPTFTLDGTKAFVSNRGSNQVTVISTISNTVLAALTVGGTDPSQVVFSRDGSRAYTLNYGNNTLTVIDTTQAVPAVIASVGVGALNATFHNAPVFSPDGKRLYVADNGFCSGAGLCPGGNTVAVIDSDRGGSLLAVGPGGSVTSTGTAPLALLDGSTVTTGTDLVSVRGGTVHVAGPGVQLQNLAHGHLNVGSGTLLGLSSGASVTTGGPAVDIANSDVRLTGAVMRLDGGSTFTNTAGPVVRVSGGSLTADSLVIMDQASGINLTGTLLDASGASIQLRILGEGGGDNCCTLTLAQNEPMVRLTSGTTLTFTQNAGQDHNNALPDFNPRDLGSSTGAVALVATGGSTLNLKTRLTEIRPNDNVTPLNLTATDPLVQLTDSTINQTDTTLSLIRVATDNAQNGAGTVTMTSPTLSAVGNSSINASGTILSIEDVTLKKVGASAFIGLDGGSGPSLTTPFDLVRIQQQQAPTSATLPGPLLQATGWTIDTHNPNYNSTVATPTVGSNPQFVAISPNSFGSSNSFLAYVTNSTSNTVSVVDTATNTVIATVTLPAGSNPAGVAVSSFFCCPSARAYVANPGNNSVSVIDTASNALLTTITGVGGAPQAVAVTPNANFVYVANKTGGTVSVIDTSSNSVTGSPITVGVQPAAIALTPDGSRAYVVNSFNGAGGNSVTIIDTGTNVVIGSPIAVGTNPQAIAITPNGARAFVANSGSQSVSVISTATNSVITTVTLPLGSNPRGIAISPDGGRVYVTNSDGNIFVIDAIAPRMLPTLTVNTGASSNPLGIAFTPDGSRAVVATAGGDAVTVFDTNPGGAVLNIAGGGSLTGTGKASLVQFNGSTVTSSNLVRVDGAGPSPTSLTLAGGLLSAANATISTIGDIIDVLNGATVTGTGAGEFIHLTDTALTAGTSPAFRGRLLTIAGTGGPTGTTPASVTLGGRLLVLDGASTLTFNDDMVFVTAGNTLQFGGCLLCINPGGSTVTVNAGTFASGDVLRVGGTVTNTVSGSALLEIANTGFSGLTAAGALVNLPTGGVLQFGQGPSPQAGLGGPILVLVGGNVTAAKGITLGTGVALNATLAENATIGNVPTGAGPSAVALQPSGTRVYVANAADNTVSVYNAATTALIATVPLPGGSQPSAVAVSPANEKVFVADKGNNTISVIDITSNLVRATLNLPPGSQPQSIAFTPDGKTAYVGLAGTGQVAAIDIAHNNSMSFPQSGLGSPRVAVTPDGTRYFVADATTNLVNIYRTSDNGLVASVPVAAQGTGPTGIAFNGNGSKAYVTLANSGKVAVIDNGAAPALRSGTGYPLTVGAQPASIALGFNRLYVANGGNGTVSVIDPNTDTVVSTFGGSPNLGSALAVVANGDRGYVVNSSTNTLSVFTAAPILFEVNQGTLHTTGSLVDLPAGASIIYLNERIVLATGRGTVQADASLLNVAGSLTQTAGTALIQATGSGRITTTGTVSHLVSVPSGGSLSLAGAGNLLSVVSGLFTPVVTVSGDVVNIAGTVTGPTNASFALVNVAPSNFAGARLDVTGSVIDVAPRGTLTLNTLTGASGGSTGLNAAAPGVVQTGGDVVQIAGTVNQTGNGGNGPLVNVTGNLASPTTAPDAESGLTTLGTGQPLRPGGALVSTTGAGPHGNIQRAVRVDTALLDTSQPFLNLTGGSLTVTSVTSGLEAIRLANNANVTSTASAVVNLTGGSSLNLNTASASLITVGQTSGSKLKTTGDLISLSLGSTLTVSNGSLLNIQGGSYVSIAGSLVNFGSGSSTITIGGTGAILNIQGGSSAALLRYLLNFGAGGGTINLSNALCGASDCTNYSGIIVKAATGATINIPGATVLGSGTINHVHPGTAAGADADIVIGGTTTSLMILTPGSAIPSGSGTTTISGPQAIPTFGLASGDILDGQGALTVTGPGTSTWSGGTMSGTGTTTIGAGGVAISGSVTLDQRPLTTGGATNWNGGAITIQNGGTITNIGTWTAATDNAITAGAGGGTFTNQGAFVKAGTTGTTTVGVTFNNSGLVDVQSGTVSFQGGGSSAAASFNAADGAVVDFAGGTFTWNAGTILTATGTGTARISGGTVDVAGEVTAQNVDLLSGATLSGSGRLDVNGNFTWSGGTMTGSGRTSIWGAAALSGTSLVLDQGRTLTVSNGTATWTGSGTLTIDNGAILATSALGLFDIHGDTTITTTTVTNKGQVLNAGTFQKSAGDGVTAVNVPFSNTGTVNVQTGTLSFQGGGTGIGNFQVSNGAALEFDSTFSLAGPSTISGGGAVTFAGNALSATPTFTFMSGEGAVLQVNGTPTVTVGGDIVNVAAGLSADNVANAILAQTGGSITAGTALSLGAGTTFVTNLASNSVADTINVGTGAQPRGVTVFPTTNRAYVPNFGSGTVSVIDTTTNAKFADVTVGTNPFAVAITPDGGKFFVVNQGSNNVTVVDATTNTVIGSPITVGTTPFSVFLAPNGARLYVANLGSVSVIDTATNAKITDVTVAGLSGPGSVTISPDSTRAYVVNAPGNSVSIIDNTLATPAVLTTLALGVGASPRSVAFRPDGARAYVVNNGAGTVSVIDNSLGTPAVVGSPVTVGTAPVAVAVTPDGKRAYVVNGGSNNVTVLDTSGSLPSVLTTIAVGNSPISVSITRDGSRVYVTNNAGGPGGTVSVISTATNTVVATLSVGTNPRAVALSPNATQAYVANTNGDTVTAFDIQLTPLIQVTGGTLTTSSHLAAIPAGASLTLDAPLLDVRAPGTVIVQNGSDVVNVGGTLTGGGDSLIKVTGVNTTLLDPDMPGQPLGTDRPLQQTGALVSANGASVTVQKVINIDTALVEATLPLLNLTGNTTMNTTTGLGVFNLANRANLNNNTANPLVRLDASQLNILNSGSLFNVAGGSKLKTAGDLLLMNNGATLNLLNGAILTVLNGSFVSINGALVNFTGTPSTINITNNLCAGASCVTFGSLRVAELPGVNPANITITNGVKGSGTINYSSGNAAAIVVGGAGSKLTIKGN